MQIVLLNYAVSSVDFIHVGENEIETLCNKYTDEGYNIGEDLNDKVEFILSHHCKYNMDEISFMYSEENEDIDTCNFELKDF